MITNLRIDNFKSLKNIDINLKKINFIVGPNASGKSNFAEALDFLSHAVRENLAYAVAEKGGFYNICHRRQRRARGGISFSVNSGFNRGDDYYSVKIAFELRTKSEEIRADFYVASEEIDLRIHNVANRSPEVRLRIFRQGSEYQIDESKNTTDQLGLTKAQEKFLENGRWLKNILQRSLKPHPQRLFISSNYALIPRVFLDEIRGLHVFQFNPRVARHPAVPSVLGELGRHGENLASALDYMKIHDGKNFKLLGSWLKDVVPSLSGLATKYTETRQLGLFFHEEGFASRWFAEDVSDGTIMSVALFYALIDKRHKVIVTEEPETSLHPWILKIYLERCRELAPQRQIIITTHSPLAVAYAMPDELFLIERKDGVTSLRNAIDVEPNLSDIIRKDLIDLGQYWLSGGLGAVPDTAHVDDGELFDKDNPVSENS